MNITGIFFRRACKSVLTANPPRPGEMVFATDTGEHGWLDETNTLVWKSLIDSGVASGNSGLESIYEASTLGWRLIGKNPIKYNNTGLMAVDISESTLLSGSSGDYSFATGFNTIAQNLSQSSFGQYNAGTSNSTILEVGMGTDENTRTNAFEIHTSGSLIAPNYKLINIDTPKSLITKEYITNKVGLENLTEGNYQGWRLFASDPNNFSNIGHKAVDLSISSSASSTMGAEGRYSFAAGLNNYAQGTYSTALGYKTSATGSYSLSAGNNTIAAADSSFSIGKFNNGTNLNNVFEIGYGQDDLNRKNVMEVSQDGIILAPELGLAEIANPKCLITKEYFDANVGGTFLGLPDTPSSYVPKKFVTVNPQGTGLELTDPPEGLISQLEIIYEAGNRGWRLFGKDPLNHTDIGQGAMDFSENTYLNGGGASGNYSLSLGRFVQSSGDYSLAIGSYSNASGAYSQSKGNYVSATGSYSEAIGTRLGYKYPNTTASGSFSKAVGISSISSGSYSKAIGYYATAPGSYSLSIGTYTRSAGSYSFALGSHTSANGSYSTAIGPSNTTNGNYSHTLGYNLIGNASYCTVVGALNTGTNLTNVFEVGNGSSLEGRTNALEVHRSGDIIAPTFDSTSYTNPTATHPKMLVTLEYLKIYYADVHDGTGLQEVAEQLSQGWRFINTNPDNYGDIGEKAIDFSQSTLPSLTIGATGNYSVAFGLNNTVSGSYSIIHGTESINSGSHSLTMGYKQNNAGSYSISIGSSQNNTNNYSLQIGTDNANYGSHSLQLGTGLLNYRDNGISLGSYNKGQAYAYYRNDGIRNYSFSEYNILEIGNGTSSGRSNAFEIQSRGQIIAPSSLLEEIIEPKALVTKEYVDFFRLGTGLERIFEAAVSGWRLIGEDATLRGDIGLDAIDMTLRGNGFTGAIGDRSFAIGDNNKSYGNYSTTTGRNNISSGTASFTTGIGNTAYGYASTSIGKSNTAYGHYSFSTGYQVKSNSNYSTSIGRYNLPNYNNLFEIGYGSSDTVRFNVFEVNKYGQVLAPGLAVSEIIDPKCLITKEYFDLYNSGLKSLFINDTVTDMIYNSTYMLADTSIVTNKTWSSSYINSKITPLASKVYVDAAIGNVVLNSGFDDSIITLTTGWSSSKINSTFATLNYVDSSITNAINGTVVSSLIDDTQILASKTWSSSYINSKLIATATKAYVDTAVSSVNTANIINDTIISPSNTYSSTKISNDYALKVDVSSSITTQVSVATSALIDDTKTVITNTWSSSNINYKISLIVDDTLTNTTNTWSLMVQ